MSKLQLLCRNATAFSADGAIDEDAFRQMLQRFVDAKIGIYLASSGSGESSAMTADELLRVYRIGVDVCKGKVPVNGNPPEKPTVRETLEHINLAIKVVWRSSTFTARRDGTRFGRRMKNILASSTCFGCACPKSTNSRARRG